MISKLSRITIIQQDNQGGKWYNTQEHIHNPVMHLKTLFG